MSISAIAARMEKARDRYGPYTSSHEGYGVIAEEMAELLTAIRSNDMNAIYREACDVAAAAAKLAMDCGNTAFQDRSRK